MARKLIYRLLLIVIITFASIWAVKNLNLNPTLTIGQDLDNLNGIPVYYNGGINKVTGRNTTPDGYNLGLKYQCVEFVKRYYYEHYNHKMPNSYGNAKDFYNKTLTDGSMNKDRNLIQYSNPSSDRPAIGDLIVFDGTLFNRYGHVAIISKVQEKGIEIIQQNPGPYGKSRERLKITYAQGKWKIEDKNTLGWLRLK